MCIGLVCALVLAILRHPGSQGRQHLHFVDVFVQASDFSVKIVDFHLECLERVHLLHPLLPCLHVVLLLEHGNATLEIAFNALHLLDSRIEIVFHFAKKSVKFWFDSLRLGHVEFDNFDLGLQAADFLVE